VANSADDEFRNSPFAVRLTLALRIGSTLQLVPTGTSATTTGGGIVQAAAIQSQLLELVQVLTNKCRNCHMSLKQPVVQVLQLVLNYRTRTGTGAETKCSTSTGARTGTN
jgi:hypothetical protein